MLEIMIGQKQKASFLFNKEIKITKKEGILVELQLQVRLAVKIAI
jgi:hypothetical protein